MRRDQHFHRRQHHKEGEHLPGQSGALPPGPRSEATLCTCFMTSQFRFDCSACGSKHDFPWTCCGDIRRLFLSMQREYLSGRNLDTSVAWTARSMAAWGAVCRPWRSDVVSAIGGFIGLAKTRCHGPRETHMHSCGSTSRGAEGRIWSRCSKRGWIFAIDR